MKKGSAEKYLLRIEEFLSRQKDRAVAEKTELTVQQFSRILEVNDLSALRWTREGWVVNYRQQGNAYIYRLDHVRPQLERIAKGEDVDSHPSEYECSREKNVMVIDRINETLKVPAPESLAMKLPPAAPIHQHVHLHVGSEDFFARVREKAFKAAKEAYRDVILEAADQAKAKGDKDLALQLFDDFIHMEEGLRVIYERA